MGILRLVLALSVVFAHVGIDWPISSRAAVEAFFVISGFYMALVLDGRYSDKWTFWTNRLLRLFPSYLLIAALSALWLWERWPQFYERMTTFDAMTNLLIVGQDVSTYREGAMLLPQGWTLALEIYFYALVPFLVLLPSRSLIALLALSIAGRFVFGGEGFWSYRFFPFELAFFLAGILLYRTKKIPLTKRDQLLGELSYPIYINHIFLARMIHEPWTVVAASIVLAVVMVMLIERPLDRLRESRIKRTPRTVAPASPYKSPS